MNPGFTPSPHPGLAVRARGLQPRSARRQSRQAGILLIETLVYIAVFAVVVGVALGTFHRFWTAARRLEVRSDQIIRVLRAGEVWRADLRRAVVPPEIIEAEGLPTLRIRHRDGEVEYRDHEGRVWRRAAPEAPWIDLLRADARSSMRPDPRGSIQAWRWDLEIASRKGDPRFQPRFSFVAVSNPNSSITP